MPLVASRGDGRTAQIPGPRQSSHDEDGAEEPRQESQAWSLPALA